LKTALSRATSECPILSNVNFDDYKANISVLEFLKSSLLRSGVKKKEAENALLLMKKEIFSGVTALDISPIYYTMLGKLAECL